MKAGEVLAHFQAVGHWVDWERTCDRFLHGDGEAEVTHVATGWTATSDAIRAAADLGAELFVCHEPLWLPREKRFEAVRRSNEARRELLNSLGMTVVRCHDTWDRMPEVGIPDTWAEWLGFDTEPRPVASFYRICLVGDMTAQQLAERVLARVRELGQDSVQLLGDPDQKVSRMAVGTGAITFMPTMHELDADVLLMTDDGMNTWEDAIYAHEWDLPLIVVNHATAELPGMMAMAGYLREQFAGLEADYIPHMLKARTVM